MKIASRIFAAQPMGMNLRNALILKVNPAEAIILAKDKARAKRTFSENGVPVPRTYFEITSPQNIPRTDQLPEEFVIKPNLGLGGNGILVLKKQGGICIDPAGFTYTPQEITSHIRKILDGEFSAYFENDLALIEERIYPSQRLMFRDAIGLPDIRIICFVFRPVMAMLRYSTFQSRGRANLSAGAVGMAISMESGEITHIHTKKGKATISPADLGVPGGFNIPKWEEMKTAAARASMIAGLGFAGVDIILDRDDRVMVLEINGRPGLEIQNINERSLREFLPVFSSALLSSGTSRSGPPDS